jgi:hypothetical protein
MNIGDTTLMRFSFDEIASKILLLAQIYSDHSLFVTFQSPSLSSVLLLSLFYLNFFAFHQAGKLFVFN